MSKHIMLQGLSLGLKSISSAVEECTGIEVHMVLIITSIDVRTIELVYHVSIFKPERLNHKHDQRSFNQSNEASKFQVTESLNPS